jgi:hypothetical protein
LGIAEEVEVEGPPDWRIMEAISLTERSLAADYCVPDDAIDCIEVRPISLSKLAKLMVTLFCLLSFF